LVDGCRPLSIVVQGTSLIFVGLIGCPSIVMLSWVFRFLSFDVRVLIFFIGWLSLSDMVIFFTICFLVCIRRGQFWPERMKDSCLVAIFERNVFARMVEV
jgi:hypothetical protein